MSDHKYCEINLHKFYKSNQDCIEVMPFMNRVNQLLLAIFDWI